MKRVVVASENPVKVEATRSAFSRMFPEDTFEVIGIAVDSGVDVQPRTDEETYQGALNRTDRAAEEHPDADFWVGIEGGVDEHWCGELGAFAWAVVRAKDGTHGKGCTSMFFVPPAVATLVRGGMELGPADDQVFGKENNKQKSGVVGSLTGGVIERSGYNAEAVVLALIPFKNPNLY